jgi:hypothetical protein
VEGLVTNSKSHQTLSVLLFALSVIAVLASLICLLAPGWILSLALGTVPPPNTPFEHVLLSGIGIFALPFGYLLCVAARDPVRHVAVVNAMIMLLVVAALVNFYFAIGHQIEVYYPAGYLIIRGVVQVILAGVLFKLRPTGSPASP